MSFTDTKCTQMQIIRALDQLYRYDGAKYLLELVAHPQQPIHVTALRNLFHALPSAAETGVRAEPGVNYYPDLPYSVDPSPELPLPALDAVALGQYKQRLMILNEKIALANSWHDQAPLEDLYNERDFLIRHLKQNLDHRGKPVILHHRTKKDYLAVRKAICKTLEKLAILHPALAKHLANAISTGYHFCYQGNPQ